MAVQQQHGRCLTVGCLIALLGSLGLMTLSVVYALGSLNSTLVFTLVLLLTLLMGAGALMAVFSLRQS